MTFCMKSIFFSVILDKIGSFSWANIPIMIIADIQGLIPREKKAGIPASGHQALVKMVRLPMLFKEIL